MGKAGLEIGINMPVSEGRTGSVQARELASAAERLGFAELYLGEHVVLFDKQTDMYPATGSEPTFPPDSPLPDPLVGLAFLAGCTKTIRLGAGVMLLPQRNPVYTAKHVATLDWISGGRLDLGIGTGWNRQEYEACGVPWAERGQRCDEYIEVMRQLWVEPVSAYSGRFYTLPPCRQYPKPLQKPHPPLWIGGWSDAAVERAAQYGDGWYGFDLPPDTVAALVARIRDRAEALGRDPAAIKIVCGLYLELPLTPAKLEAYRRAGVEQLVLSFTEWTPDGQRSQLDQYAHEYL